MIESGTPWSRTTSLTYNLAKTSEESVVFIGTQWADLVNLSTITQIESFPLWVLGNPDMKSMEMWSHFHPGIGRCWSLPLGLWCFTLICWQSIQDATNSATTTRFLLIHQNHCFRWWQIFVPPGCIVYFVWWASSINSFLSSLSIGTQTIWVG